MATFHAPVLAKIVQAILNHLPNKYLRERLTGPRQALVILLSSIHSGTNRIGVGAARLVVYTRLGGAIGWQDGWIPSTSALCRAIRKLDPALLESVIEFALNEVNRAFDQKHCIDHRRAVALDGVRINARRTSILARWLGLPQCGKTKKAHQPQALVVSARCVVTGVTLAQEIVKNKGSERACARKMVKKLACLGPMVILMDRGFPAGDLIAQLLVHRIDFVIRMPGGKRTWKELQGKTTGPAYDTMIQMHLRTGDGRWANPTLRLILTTLARRGRSKRNRKSEQTLLLTNLTGKYWNTGRIIALYHRRWDIETSFREDKRLLGATRSHACTKNGFINELLALQIYRILMTLIQAQVVKEVGIDRWDDAHAKRISTPQLIQVAWWIVEGAYMSIKTCTELLKTMIQEIARDMRKKRPNRSFPRVCKGVEGVWKKKSENGGY